MRLGPPLPTLLLIIATTACAEPLVFDDWTIPVPEGAEIIEYTHVPLEQRTERIELVEDLVIGGDGDPQAQFYQAFGAAVDERGNMYVMEYGNRRVQVFDPEGRYLRTLGSEGQGPGELQEPQYITIAGDTVVVVDPANGRLNYWSAAGGAFIGAEPLDERSLEVFGQDDGTLVGTHVIFHREPEFWRERMLGHFSHEGRELTRYFVFRLLPSMSVTIPAVVDRMAVTPSGDVYLTRGDRYQVLAFDVDGTPRWALRTTYPTPEIPEEIFENALAMLRERRPDYQRPDNWPERMPAIGNLVVDGAGNLYVFHYVFVPRGPMGERIVESPDEYTVDVYAPDGQLLSAAVIDTMGWTAARGDYVYSLGRDPDTEEEVLRRYRLVRPWER